MLADGGSSTSSTRYLLTVWNPTMTPEANQRIAQRQLRPAVAVLVGLLLLGLGQLYNAQGRKALLLVGLVAMFTAISLFALFRSFAGFVVLATLSLILAVVVHVDAFRSARSLGTALLLWYSRWPFFVFAILFYAFLIPPLLRAVSPVVAFRVPSSSMSPTLLPGDYFMDEKIDGASTTFSRGDLVVFEAPDTGENLLKRVIGLPGEQIEIENANVLVNGTKLEEPYVSGRHDRSPPGSNPMMDNMSPMDIPAGMVLLLGDDRLRSRDSRHFGSVPVTAIRARALYCYWASSPDRWGRRFD